MDIFAQVVERIIKEQQSIIGPMALDMAKKVTGLQVVSADEVRLTGNGKQILDALVNQYAKLFGKASVEICKEAFSVYSDKIPATEVPDILKN